MTATYDPYIWHETIQTQHTRRSFLSEVAPDVLAAVQGWLAADRFSLPGGYECVILRRGVRCLEAEVYTAGGVRLVHLGVAVHPRCAEALWSKLGGAPSAQPQMPWCGVSLDPAGQRADPLAYEWLGDFERCLAWAFLGGA